MMETLTLYHGTDGRLITMSQKEREKYFKNVRTVVAALWRVFEPYQTQLIDVKIETPMGIGYTKGKALSMFKEKFEAAGKNNLYYNLSEKLMMLEANKRGSELYQYDALYLTDSRDKARGYALRSFAGGEIGLLAYRMIEGIDLLRLPEHKPTPDIIKAEESVRDFGKEGSSDPVIVTFKDVYPEDLLTEDGRPVPSELLNLLLGRSGGLSQSFRYLRDADLSRRLVEHIQP